MCLMVGMEIKVDLYIFPKQMNRRSGLKNNRNSYTSKI